MQNRPGNTLFGQSSLDTFSSPTLQFQKTELPPWPIYLDIKNKFSRPGAQLGGKGAITPPLWFWQFSPQGEATSIFGDFPMIRGVITVLSALKMRNFTLIFPNIFSGGHGPSDHPPKSFVHPLKWRDIALPPRKFASCAPGIYKRYDSPFETLV